MKVCLLNAFYFPDILGGAEISVKILAEKLNELGIETFVISTGNTDKVEYIQGIKVYRVNIGGSITAKEYLSGENIRKIDKLIYKVSEIKNPTINKKIKQIFEKEKPNIVHVNNVYGISLEVLNICNSMNIKIVQTLRDYFFICPKATLQCNKGNSCESSVICKMYRLLFNNLTKKIDYITAPSKYVINEFLNVGYFKKAKYSCVYNAIDIDKYNLDKIYEEKLSREISYMNFVYLGALSNHKGLIELVEAFKGIDNKNIKLHIAGKGHLEEFVIESALNDDRIKYHGFITGDKLDELLKKGDVLVAPSLWNEPFGRIVLDAYKFAMPVVVSNNGGLPEIVDNGKTGVVLKDTTISSIQRSLTYFAENKSIIKAMLISTRNKIEEFTIDKQVEYFIKIYKELNS